MKKQLTAKFQVRVEPEILDELKAEVDTIGTTVGQYVRWLIVNRSKRGIISARPAADKLSGNRTRK